MKESIRQATKAQALAVRTYLRSLGCELTHTQALEVLARGQGMRSRHVLAADLDTHPVLASSAKPVEPKHYMTQIGYRYVDGSNCKRYSQMLFRGRLTPNQLRYIQEKLDDEMYFVPAQVGFENLAFAFTDFGGDDHGWHTMEFGDRKDWELDADGYVLQAGDVSQVPASTAGAYATDADTDNLFFRFARVRRWMPTEVCELLEESLHERPEEADEDDLPSDDEILARWSGVSALHNCRRETLLSILRFLRAKNFSPAESSTAQVEWQRPVGPGAYQIIILQECEQAQGELALNVEVSTYEGTCVTETPMFFWTDPDTKNASRLHDLVDLQFKAALVDPMAWQDAV